MFDSFHGSLNGAVSSSDEAVRPVVMWIVKVVEVCCSGRV